MPLWDLPLRRSATTASFTARSGNSLLWGNVRTCPFRLRKRSFKIGPKSSRPLNRFGSLKAIESSRFRKRIWCVSVSIRTPSTRSSGVSTTNRASFTVTNASAGSPAFIAI